MLFAVIIANFVVLLLIGAFAARRVHNLSDYYVGGKRLGNWVVAFSARASGESAWLYLGLTGLGAMVGARALWVVAGECLGVAIAWLFMAAPFKRATDQFGSITVPDYLVSHFAANNESSRSARVLRLTAAAALSLGSESQCRGVLMFYPPSITFLRFRPRRRATPREKRVRDEG